MKVKITYQRGEERRAALMAAFAKGLAPDAKVKESDKHPPYRHIYISSKEPPRETGED